MGVQLEAANLTQIHLLTMTLLDVQLLAGFWMVHKHRHGASHLPFVPGHAVSTAVTVSAKGSIWLHLKRVGFAFNVAASSRTHSAVKLLPATQRCRHHNHSCHHNHQ